MTQNKSGIYSGLAVKSSHFLKPCKNGREFFLSRFLVGVWLLYNAVLVSAVQQRASAIRIHVSPPSWACLPPPSHPLGHHRALGRVSLCSTTSSHQLSILNMIVYTCQRCSLNSSHPLLPLFCPQVQPYVYVSIPTLQIGSSVPPF